MEQLRIVENIENVHKTTNINYYYCLVVVLYDW